MKYEELNKYIKEKVLFIGNSGVGKTYQCVQTAKFLAENGKKVIFIDPEFGAERELRNLGKEWFDKYGDNLELLVTPDWKSFRQAALDETECFIKIIDGIKEAMELFKDYLEQKFIAQGYYLSLIHI